MKNRTPCVRVGVAGHRLLAHPERLATGIRDAVRRITEVHEGKEPWFLTSLAEGADQLVIDTMDAAVNYTAVLPQPLEEYASTLSSPAARDHLHELLSAAREVVTLVSGEQNAFDRAGDYILENSDVVLVVWDGQPARGKGGTGDFVDKARRAGLPLAWVHATPGGKHPGDVTVTFERL